jgi:hypothetical protein
MLGKGEAWMADNHVNLKVDRDKSKGSIDRTYLRLPTFHA